MSNNRVTKYNRDIKINAATIIIAAVLLYALISLFRMSHKDPISIYKVSKSNINNNITLEGVAVREEKIINSNKSGYVCYYIRDGEKIKKNSMLCTIDESGRIKDFLADSAEYENLLTTVDYNNIRSTISLYKASYKDVNYFDAYNFQNNINNKVTEVTNEILMKESSSVTSGLSSVTSPYSGTVTYYIDGYENIDINNISKDLFDKSQYKKETLKTGDVIENNSQLIKILPNEKWNIIAPITDEQIEIISAYDHIRFRLNNSSFDILMPYTIINGSDGKYINISLDKYMTNFIAERFLSIEIVKADDTGLKVPTSALVEKDIYKIPISYFSGGGNQTSTNRLNVEIRDPETGDITIKQIKPTIYKMDEEYYYVDPLAFDASDVLLDINTNNTIAVSLLDINKLTGVYLANRGTAEFRMVTVMKTVDEFALIKNEEDIKAYDNIVLDASSVNENQIIY